MKKTTTLLSFLALTTFGFAQSPRMSLYEEFTGENCPPCAGTNPILDPILTSNLNNTIPLKWQVAIPSAPTSLTSLYQQNKTEIDQRDAYYSISSAPSGIQDGQSPTVFGAASDHPIDIDANILNTSAAVTSPFTIAMTRAWDATFSTITVSVTLTATGNYTTTGTNLKFRLVMTEKEVHYAVAPGSNGEKDFHWVARKSFPTLANGTAMANTWTVGQSQTFTVSCPLPSYIWDKSEVEMVGFIQDDANKYVLQAGLAAAAPLTDDAKAFALGNVNPIVCGTTLNPQAIVSNIGSNAITSMTINPYLNAVAQAPYIYTGSIAAGSSATIALNPVTVVGGNHTFSVNIVQVNGGTDNNIANNTKKQAFSVVTSYAPAPIVQSYSTAVFPGTGWLLVNTDGGSATNTWQRSTAAGAFGVAPAGCAKYNFYNNANVGDVDELIFPAMSLTGLTAPMLTFDVAKARYGTYSDKLEVLVSTDCGASWTTVYSKSDASGLTTAPSTTVAFTPTGTQWRTESVNLTSYANAAQVLVKFAATNDYGNNLYLDNVNLSENATSIKTVDANISSVELYPNPTANETTVNVTLVNTSDVAVTVLNNVGQIVYQSASTLNAGSNKVNIDTRNLASGIYNVLVATENGSVTKKLSVTK